ncbi:FAD binding domain-containing protein [Dothidotthia symphoricarpi CBS 119687]|uniref:FAD binding domain-containing protein n=1 Tax=Dothidotthia symphoricarpi CBS 119687 TaxID=1392245 RepID=A0A6A6AAS1_9PLEO|nr:FAD binding domain-containing protein [Dothidotthia symphoricarpi CBS 119687]KAF2127968.1 FAD binding domain-containing protein [Dothidotthia symphoricarpi CBS 119687]
MDRISRLLLSALLGVQLVAAAPDQATTVACKEINLVLPGKVLTPTLLALEYESETSKYWSTTLREIDPACIVQPTSAEDVSAVVKILLKYPTVKFATRSGGHDPNVGHSSVQDGVLIAMTDLAGATYDAAKKVAYVKPGGEWNDVIGALEPSGVTITGGRLGIVGVGGYLLQGGISFLSAQEGLAADNIIGWETVMSNGSIVNVDAATHPDLAQAMRGSGSQFGIVTKFTVKVHPIGDVFGGMCIYTAADQEPALYSAFHNFAGTGANDSKAAIIFTDNLSAGGAKTKIVFYFYDGPVAPTTGPFADFLKIPGLICAPKTQKYSELLRNNGESSRHLDARVSFRTYTLPYIASRPQMYQEVRDKYANITAPFLTALRPKAQFSTDFQPLPSIVGTHTAAKGGNAMGLTASDPDRLILEIQGSWQLASDDEQGYGITRQLTEWLDTQVPLWLAQAGMPSQVYLPLFMNDAAGDQPVVQSYSGYAKFRALQRWYDPLGLFSRRAGGFKY